MNQRYRPTLRPRTAPSAAARAQNRILAVVLILLFVQLGLFIAGWEAALARDFSRTNPYAVLSVACFAINLYCLKRLQLLESEETEDNG